MIAPRRIEGPGTAEAAWRGWEGLARAPVRPLDDWLRADDRLVVVAPHPDDEILGGGALASRHAARGGTVRVVAVTDGEASHRGVAGSDPARLAATRRQESAAGLASLLPAAAAVIRLGLPDAGVAACAEGLTAALLDLLRPMDHVVTTWRLDGHPDHDATGQAAAAACATIGCRLIEAPVWMWHWAAPGDPRVPWRRLAGLEVPPETMERRRHAIAAHRSQLEPRGAEGPVLTAGILDRMMRPIEHLFVPTSAGVDGAPPVSGRRPSA